MGYFADVPKVIDNAKNALLWKTIKRTKETIDTIDNFNLVPKQDRFVPPVTLIIDECNVTINYDPPSFFGDYYHLPAFSSTYRNPACNPPSVPPPPQPLASPDIIPVKMPISPTSCKSGLPVLAIKIGTYSNYSILGAAAGVGYAQSKDAYYIKKQSVTVISVEYPVAFDTPPSERFRYPAVIYGARITLSIDAFISYNKIISDSAEYSENAHGESTATFNHTYDVWMFSKDVNDRLLALPKPTVYGVNTGYEFLSTKLNTHNFPIGEAIFGYPEAKKRWESDYPTNNIHTEENYGAGKIVRENLYQIIVTCGDLISPPPPPPPKDCDCMAKCCPKFDDTLLKLILKRIGSLPADVPTSYLTKDGVQPVQIKKVESLTEFIAWFAERFDETLGEFEITIEVNDTDLTKEGEQKQTIRLPNLAESIAEMFSLMIHSNINNELILNIVNRTLIESGQIKQSEYKIFSAIHAVIDYMGFPTHTITEKMPLTFKPGELSFDKLLKESELDVSVLTYTEKATLAATLQTLLQAAAIIRASHFRGTPGNKTQVANIIKEDLKKLLGEPGDLTEQIKTFVTDINKVYDAIDNKPD